MQPTLDADTIQILVALPGSGTTPPVFTPLGGEDRGRLQLERSFSEAAGLGSDKVGSGNAGSEGWNLPLPGGRAAMSIEIEGRSQHGPAEAYLHACAFQGLSCRLRLRIGASSWVEGTFLLQRFQFDAPHGEAARYAFTALGHGPVDLVPLPLA